MSFSFRTPAEECLNRFNQEEQSKIAQPALNNFISIERDCIDAFNFALSDKAKQRLSESGIHLSPYSFKVHSHPACKTLENYILYNVLPAHLDNSFYFVGTKHNKLDFLKRRHANLTMIKTINRFVTSKDRCRYTNDFVIASSRELRGRPDLIDTPTLRDLVPRVITESARNLFMHDELHYWSVDAMVTFLTAVKPKKLLCSLVAPPEILAGAKESLNPWCYQFRIEKGTLVFMPDGVASECYRQPLTSVNWLKVSKVLLPDGDIYCVDVLHSKFCHHLLAFTKGDAIVDVRRDFSGFDAISIASMDQLRADVGDCYPIAYDLVMRTYCYLQTLKKPDLQSGVAKLCQMIGCPTGAEISFITDFSKLVIGTVGIEKILCKSFFKHILAFIIGAFPKGIAKLSQTYRSVTLSQFIKDLKPFSFSVKTMEVSCSFLLDIELMDLNESIHDESIDKVFEKCWGDGIVSKFGDRVRSPYSGIKAGWAGFNPFFSVFSSEKVILNVFKDSYSNEQGCYLLRDDWLGNIKTVLKRTRVGLCVLHSGAWDNAVRNGYTMNFIKVVFWANLKGDRKFTWFMISKRFNQKFLSEFEMVVKVADKTEELYSRVVGEIKGVIHKNRLAKTGPSLSYDNGVRIVVHPLLRPCSSVHEFKTFTSEQKERREACNNVSLTSGETAVFCEPFEMGDLLTEDEADSQKADFTFSDPEGIKCSCGLEIPVKSLDIEDLEGLSNSFNFSDKLKSRRATLFSRSGKCYQYNGGSHESNGWDSRLDKIIQDCGFATDDFNQCLVQKYEDGAGIPLHKDDEKCYDLDHAVLTVQISGGCLFNLQCDEGKVSKAVTGLKYFLMPHGFQTTHKHGVEASHGDRISMTFRKEIPTFEPSHSKKVFNIGSKGKRALVSQFDNGSVAQLRKILEDSNKLKVRLELCDCSATWHSGKYADVKSSIRKCLQIEGFADLDTIFLFLGTEKRRQILEVESGGAVVCIEGVIGISEQGNVNSRVVQKDEVVVVEDLVINWASPNTIGFFAFKPKTNVGGDIKNHSNSCNFSGFSEFIDVPIVLGEDFRPADFNAFSVPGDGDCFWHSVSHLTGVDGLLMKEICKSRLNADSGAELKRQMGDGVWAEREAISFCCKVHDLRLKVLHFREQVTWIFGHEDAKLHGVLFNKDWHFEPCMPKNGCVVRAISRALGRKEIEVLAVLGKPKYGQLFEEISGGKGLNIFELEQAMEVFGIHAKVDVDGQIVELNESGAISASFQVKDNHMEYLSDTLGRAFSPEAVGLNTVSKSSLDILASAGTMIQYKPSIDRASALARSFREATTGVLCSELFNDCPDLLDSSKLNDQERDIGVILGTFGCGKSTTFKSFIEANNGKATTFVSPRRQLADSIRDDLLGSRGIKNKKKGKQLWSVKTFESFLLSVARIKRGHVVILDEVQLFPPGYLDLVMLRVPKGVSIFLAGDPCQSRYDSDKDRQIFEGVESDIFHLLNGKSYSFNMLSFRFQNPMFEGRLPCRFEKMSKGVKAEDYRIYDSIEEFASDDGSHFECVLVAGFEEKKVIRAHMGQKYNCLTFGESTGMSFNSGAILISYDSTLCDDFRWITALSRFRKSIAFINVTGMSIEGVAMKFHGRSLYKFLTGKASESDVYDMLPGKPVFKSGFSMKLGKSEGVREEKLSGDPWLKTEIFLGQSEDQEIAEIEEEVKNESWFKTHVPIVPMESIRAGWVHKIMLKEFREVRMGLETTEQFAHEHSKNNGKVITNAAERFEAIYPRHRGNDSVTFAMAVRKRLKFSKPNLESAKFKACEFYGKFLLDEFLKHVPLRPGRNEQMMSEALHEFEEKKTSKSTATIENHSKRSCRDWLLDVAFIFMKSQHCTKFGNRLGVAKAGQTLACFQHSVLCRFAPYMRYIEKKLMESLPSRFYVHSGKSLDSLNDWVVKNKFHGECTESDYEAFDASQDHFILAFEVALMNYLGLPHDLVDDYVFIKTHLGSKLGSFAIMRFTGEASTFLFNTMANMLFTFLKYGLKGDESICFAGDDMCANRRLTMKLKHVEFMKKMGLKAKVEFTKKPTFCGWNLCRYGIFKKPQLILERLMIALENGNLKNCMDNYAIEVSYAYKLGELLKEVMADVDLENHYCCVRFIVKNKSLLQSDVVKVFANSA